MRTRGYAVPTQQDIASLYSSLVNDEYYRLTVLLVFVWGFLDTASTFIAISVHGTPDNEWNPLMRELLQTEFHLFTATKIGGVIAVMIIAILGRQYIVTVYGWNAIFRGMIWAGIIITILNLYAAFTVVTGVDPVFHST